MKRKRRKEIEVAKPTLPGQGRQVTPKDGATKPPASKNTKLDPSRRVTHTNIVRRTTKGI